MIFKKLIMPIICLSVFGFVIYYFLYPTFKKENIIVVPSVGGHSLTEAKKDLDEINAKYKIIYEESELDEDTVIKTIPQEGSVINSLQTIIIYVSKKEEIKIDNYVGQLLDDVALSLKDYDINLKIDKIKDNTKENGTILSQTPISGELKNIKEIQLTISYIDQTIVMPSFIGENVNQILSFSNKYGFQIYTIFINSEFERYTVLYQETMPGVKLYENSGQKLTFYIAK